MATIEKSLSKLASRGRQADHKTERLTVIEPSPTFGELFGMFLGLTGLRAFWPTSATDFSGVTDRYRDISSNGLHLTDQGAISVVTYNDFVPYLDFDGSTAVALRADQAQLDLTASITAGGWFWADTLAASMALMSKQGAAGNRSWILFAETGTNAAQVEVSNDGTATVAVQSAANSFNTGAWHFVAFRYTPSTELAIFIDGVKTINTTSIPASLFNSSADFNIAAANSAGSWLDGRATLCWLCAIALSDAMLLTLYNRSRVFFWA